MGRFGALPGGWFAAAVLRGRRAAGSPRTGPPPAAAVSSSSSGNWASGRCAPADEPVCPTARRHRRKDKAMTIPVLMVVDDDPESLGILDGTLRRRYGEDYLIISDASPAAALDRLRELRGAGREVALGMAAAAGMAGPGAELPPQAPRSAPAAHASVL